jgi:ATP-dependent helicase HrpB
MPVTFLQMVGEHVSTQPDPLATELYLVIASLADRSPRASIELTASVTQANIESFFADQIVEPERIAWNDKTQTVRAVRQRKLGPCACRTEYPLP